MVRVISLTCVLAFAAFGQAPAASPAKAAKIEELLTMNKAEQMMEPVKAQILGQVGAQLKQMGGGKDMQPAIDELQAAIAEHFDKNLSWQKLKPEYIKIYAANFTDSELDAILAFQKTPAGQSMIKKMPIVFSQGMEVGQRMMKDTQGDLMTKINAIAQKYKGQGGGAGAPPNGPPSPAPAPQR